MPLSRLDNFLKNVRGNVIYVAGNDLDATDDIANQGNSRSRPFLTIQRALLEAVRFSYQIGLNNDRFEYTTIVVEPGVYYVDNRPGWIPDGSNFRLRSGEVTATYEEMNSRTNFDLQDPNNRLYTINSIYGGVIIPRGCTIVSVDADKTQIRPLYVPSTTNENIDASTIFRITSGSSIDSLTFFDGDPTSTVYTDYTTTRVNPDYSHHKLSSIEYVDGVNDVDIKDEFIDYSTNRTDLQMYYEKISILYGESSNRPITPTYPAEGVDLQPLSNEFEIVSVSEVAETGISSIKAGDGVTATILVTVDLEDPIDGIEINDLIEIDGVSDSRYNGRFVVDTVLAQNDFGVTRFTYKTLVAPDNALPTPSGSFFTLSVDTINSPIPKISKVCVKSSYGLSGLFFDGDKIGGTKQTTVIGFDYESFQNDNNAFIRYNSSSGTFDDSTSVSNLHSDSSAKFKPDFYNYGVKATNDVEIELDSCAFTGGYQHICSENGARVFSRSATSNFGQSSMWSRGFTDSSTTREDTGYISHIIAPRANLNDPIKLEWDQIDVERTAGIGSTSRLYLYNETNKSNPPKSTLQGYHIGAADNDQLRVRIHESDYHADIVMPPTEKDAIKITGTKRYTVGRNVSTGNSITSNTLTLTNNHSLLNGETIRVISDNARLPDGLDSGSIYYSITSGVNADQLKIAKTYNDAVLGEALTINNLGGTLSIESRVSDKAPGDLGHPVQFDDSVNQWFITVAESATDNTIYHVVVGLGTAALGETTSSTLFERTPDTRSLTDRIYRYRYVVPVSSGISSAKVPYNGQVIQSSSDVSGVTDDEVALLYSPSGVSMTNAGELRNPSYIKQTTYSGTTASYFTERRHNLAVGNMVKIDNVTSSINPTGVGNSGYNGEFTVTGITSATGFTVTLADNPGTFSNNTSSRTTSLPTFSRNEGNHDFYIYNTETIQDFIPGSRDGIYYLTVLKSSNTPTVSPFNDKDQFAFSSPIKDLYPQIDRDNPVNNPPPASLYALPYELGTVVVDDQKNSVTRGTLEDSYLDFGVGIGVSDITSTDADTHTIFTDVEHGLNRITSLTITNGGAGYGNGVGAENIYNAGLTTTTKSGGATARITVNASGTITAVKVMEGGSGYAVGDTLEVTGTATTTGYSVATLTVANIYDNTGDTVAVAGVGSETYSGYNGLYAITGITTAKEISVTSVKSVSGFTTTGVGATLTSSSFTNVTGVRLDISSLVYNNVTGLATVTTVQNHGLVAGNPIKIAGATDDLYNKLVSTTEIVGLTTFIAKIGVSTDSPAVSGTLRGYKPCDESAAGSVNSSNENLGGRAAKIYDGPTGITTTLSDGIVTPSVAEIEISNVENFNFEIGDFLQIDDELLRIKSTVTGNPVSVFRGVLSTEASTHEIGSVVRRVKVLPRELRDPSLLASNGHVFNSVGFGPGNLSTSEPNNQSISLSSVEQKHSHASKTNSGQIIYNGINERAEYFVNNRKFEAVTGKEIIFDVPNPTVTGEDRGAFTDEPNASRVSAVSGNFEGGISVDGGPDETTISTFDGPVVFSNKVTSTSNDGLEANHILIQGDLDVSRKISVSDVIPTEAGNVGDIVYHGEPVTGGTLGWVYSYQNEWVTFGSVGLNPQGDALLTRVGVATATLDDELTVQVGSGSSLVAIDETGVGIGTTANEVALRVDGEVYANLFTGDGSGLRNLSNDSKWAGITTYYPIGLAGVGVGTTAPDVNYSLTVGSPGTGKTDLFVYNKAVFAGQVEFTTGSGLEINTGVSSIRTVYRFDHPSGQINAGIVTTTSIVVNTDTLVSSGTSIGIGTTAPNADLDIDGSTRLKTYHEIVKTISSNSGIAIIDLAEAQTFAITATEDITEFTLTNVPTNSTTAFTLKITNDSTTARSITVDTFKTPGGSVIDVYWPGGVVPTVTQSTGAVDIYSFMTLDGGSTLYGAINGQNFS